MKLDEGTQVPVGVYESARAWFQMKLQEYAREINRRPVFDEVESPVVDSYQFACSDLTTALTASTTVGYFRALYAGTITEIRASLLTASSSGAVTLDLNKNGSTILSTKLTIDVSEKTSEPAATPPALSSTSVADDDEFTVDIDGAGTGAAGLVFTVLVQRA